MNKLVLIGLIGLLLVGMAVFVSANLLGISAVTQEDVSDSYGDTISSDYVYEITYRIQDPGWYILPSSYGAIRLSHDNLVPLADIHKADDYKAIDFHQSVTGGSKI